MKYDFDKMMNRKNTSSLKWDQLTSLFGGEDVLPLWVADMDFPCAQPIVDALVARAKEGIYGYTIRTDEWTNAIRGWYERRHGWSIEPESILMSPSVVTSLALSVELLSEPGAGVILQPPVYYPFYDVIKSNGRQVLRSPLLLGDDGKYRMDYDSLERLMKDGAKLMLLCNPHNPGGRVWTREELGRLAELAVRYGVTVVSDEIHCDIVYAPSKHVPYATISEEAKQTSVTLLAATKTFNIPGVQSSLIVAANGKLRTKLSNRIKTLSLHMQNFFAHSATIAAFSEGDDWLDQLIPYLKGNLDAAAAFLEERLPSVRPIRPEGTYLLWVDCRALGRDVEGLKKLMFSEAKVAFSEGSVFGDQEGSGYLRINCACPRPLLMEALERFAAAVNRSGDSTPT
ncbi:MalY/PatB family protein [Paenibacillus thermotolerans]|uniref:MalY/PatB family protein n=1 Tax=Paenibacillus thermotolerans TaxID=3027807 RepID=UPI0023688CBD|nr:MULTISPECIES: MalY/PatB family protein [unclassified Paenibacillus]